MPISPIGATRGRVNLNLGRIKCQSKGCFVRRVSALLAALAISITGLTAIPSQASVTDGTYPCTSGSFTVTSGVVSNGRTCTGHANVPNGVTALGQDAFYLSGVSTISLPNTLTSIGQSALRHMPMTSVTIPGSVQTIGSIAFATTPLTSITFASPSSLTTIRSYAFQSSRFTSIVIPASVATIEVGAFQLNTHLANIGFLGTTPSGGPWEAPDSAVISRVFPCTTGNFSVANNAAHLGRTCSGTLNVPEGVVSVAQSAFESSGVSLINFPTTLTTIGASAFKGATSLTSITLPNSVSDIGELAFFDTRLTSLTIPSSVTAIRNDTFGRIPTLTSITFPSTLISIGPGSFFDTTSLASVTIPASVTTIGQYAFGNTALANVNFSGDAPASVNADAFYRAPSGAKANVSVSATGFGESGSTWRGLTVTKAASPPPSNPPTPPSNSDSSPQPAIQIQPLTRVSGVQIQPGRTAKTSSVKLQLSGVKQGLANESIKIKIFDTKGNLFRTINVPIDEVTGTMELTLPLALGEFTIEANTITAAGGVTDPVSASSPIVQRSFFSRTPTNRAPNLTGEVFAKPIVFGAGSSILTPREKRALVRISATLRETRFSVAITGFVAQSGASRSFDKTLARSRAFAVAKFLQSRGLSNILYFSGYGAINDSRNLDDLRKVEIRLIK